VPAVAVNGEGIFIDMPPRPGHSTPIIGGPSVDAWSALSPDSPIGQAADTTEIGRILISPVAVWWHSFSHRLLNAASLNSGYSSAALRERLYISSDSAQGITRGGVLIYTSQPGGDGTLGGLVDVARNFAEVLDRALGQLDNCSNDPLCGHQSIAGDLANGAACYACMFASETSCELRNMALDRNVLAANLP
jgi:hypothetical protein